MAKITLDPMYLNIKGKVGDLVHYKWKDKNCCRIRVIPLNPDTEAQRLNRKLFGEASKSWRDLPEKVKNLYNRRALKHDKALSGFNLYISDFLAGRVATTADERSEQPVFKERSLSPSVRHGKDPLHIYSVPAPYMIKTCFGKPQIWGITAPEKRRGLQKTS